MCPIDPIHLVLAALRVSKGQLTEQEAAALIFRSKRRFRAIFRKKLGASYRTVRLQVKMECAKNALLKTQAPIAAVGKQLGYRSRAKFDVSFKRAFGLTPAQYRARRIPLTEKPKKRPLRDIDKSEQFGYRAPRDQKQNETTRASSDTGPHGEASTASRNVWSLQRAVLSS